MNTITHLSPSWQAWLADNLARGCSTASLAERMVQSGFDPVFAGNAVQQARVAAQAGAAVPASPVGGYVYETPRLPQTGNVLATHDRDVRVTLRLRQPVLAVFDNLMTTGECDELVELSRVKLTRSAIVDPATGESRVIDNQIGRA
ncbi:MAG: 2-oxoglutarate-dependent dioxygenase, partial [Rhodoferax sp.]